MSFSVTDEVTGLEWKGSTFDTVFAQRRNLARPSFLRMLADIVRFNRMARGLLEDPHDAAVSLGDLLDRGRWSSQFLNWYLVPMGSSIWSADPSTFLAMPAVTFARFFANHGLLEYGNQPSWRTVDGAPSGTSTPCSHRSAGRCASRSRSPRSPGSTTAWRS